jgi:hypothetical protein
MKNIGSSLSRVLRLEGCIARPLRYLCCGSPLFPVFLALAAFQGSAYWLVSAHRFPSQTIDQIAMYRHGDIAYFPIIRALSEGNFGEQAILEKYGTGISSFPFFSSIVHAACLAVFGDHGLLVADSLVTVGMFLLLSWVLKLFGVPCLGAWSVALLVVSGIGSRFTTLLGFLPQFGSEPVNIALLLIMAAAITPMLFVLWEASEQESRVRSERLLFPAAAALLLFLTFRFGIDFWWFRFPRPFVSDLYFLGAVGVLAKMLLAGPSPGRVLAIGALLAGLVQSDIYLAFALALALPAVVLFCPVGKERKNFPMYLVKLGGFFLVSFFTINLPFFYQRLSESDQAEVRLGVFEVDRASPLVIPPGFGTTSLYLSSAALVVVVFLFHYQGKGGSARQSGNLALLPILTITSLFSLPVVTFCLGKSVQLYHFPDRVGKMISFSIVVLLSLALVRLYSNVQAIASWSRPGSRHGSLIRFSLVMAVVLASVLLPVRSALFASSRMDHMRCDFLQYDELDAYRPAFVDVTSHLRKIDRGSRRPLSLATLDHQLYSWWVTFCSGHAAVPDPFFTTLPDSEIEDRLLSYCHLLGLTRSELVDFVRDRETLALWLSHNKHQASRAHAFSPFEDYGSGVRDSIARGSIFDSWSLALSGCETARLAERYKALEGEATISFRPDIVVLLPRNFVNHRLARQSYRLHYGNPIFQIWVRSGVVSG